MTANSSKEIFNKFSFNNSSNIKFYSTFIEDEKNELFTLTKFPNIIDAAGFCICLEGHTDILIGTQQFHLNKGDICAVLPNTIVHVINVSADFKAYTFAISSEDLYNVNIASATPLFLFVKDHPCVSITKKEQEDLMKICDFAKEYGNRINHPHKKEISKHIIAVLIFEIIALYKMGKPIQQEPFSQKQIHYLKFIDLLSKNPGKNNNVDYYADKLCITPRYLSAICKEIVGHTATDCINMHILRNARLMLISTDMTIAQISDELNFSNPSFFTQFFKKYEGVTPKVYRDNNLRESMVK
ncbi:helix-turn-helix domain-containing protein [Bacteroidales bacterium OttesenSCG-928-L14]|nr:helix-turn-helix domain-containing protein [Bacteroidales bacterium OttesenSCG-928-L14]